ncbi:MAG: hypothetical protein QGH15_21245 [Kiritimatiellia bacterium]|jgi:hypothetical protein|nr:hypothetical protein [Kiritimatiellia bacterium]
MITPSADGTTGRLVGSLTMALIFGNELSSVVLLPIALDVIWLVARAVLSVAKKMKLTPPRKQ